MLDPQKNASKSSADYVGDELELFARATHWKSYWARMIRSAISDHVLEVGAGIGTNLELLKRDDQKWTSLEPDKRQAERINKCVQKRKDQGSIKVVCGTLADLKTDTRYDSILYLDVLEHIEDDYAEIDLAWQHLNQDGRLIVLAPAHNTLFSAFDQRVGHFRRYNKSLMRTLIPDQAITEKLFYLDSIGYLASLTNSVFLRQSLPSARQIWLWDTFMVPVSRVVDKLTGFAFGKSIIIVLRKP